jgi:hypothetical protein
MIMRIANCQNLVKPGEQNGYKPSRDKNNLLKNTITTKLRANTNNNATRSRQLQAVTRNTRRVKSPPSRKPSRKQGADLPKFSMDFLKAQNLHPSGHLPESISHTFASCRVMHADPTSVPRKDLNGALSKLNRGHINVRETAPSRR